MSRMNLRKKMKLSHTFESYWDMLPLELHELIMAYKKGQEAIDEDRKRIMRKICNDINLYGRLKKKWGIGHVRCRAKKCNTCDGYHMRVVGCYVNAEHEQREVYLAYNLRAALSRVDEVKSYLFFL